MKYYFSEIPYVVQLYSSYLLLNFLKDCRKMGCEGVKFHAFLSILLGEC